MWFIHVTLSTRERCSQKGCSKKTILHNTPWTPHHQMKSQCSHTYLHPLNLLGTAETLYTKSPSQEASTSRVHVIIPDYPLILPTHVILVWKLLSSMSNRSIQIPPPDTAHWLRALLGSMSAVLWRASAQSNEGGRQRQIKPNSF